MSAFCHLPALRPSPSRPQGPLADLQMCLGASALLSPVPERLCPKGHLDPSPSRPHLTVPLSERLDLTRQQPPTQSETLPVALGEKISLVSVYRLSLSKQSSSSLRTVVRLPDSGAAPVTGRCSVIICERSKYAPILVSF